MSHVTVDNIDEYIESLGLDYSAKFIPQSQSRNAKEKIKSLNWSVRISRRGFAIETDYMQGIGHALRDYDNFPRTPYATASFGEVVSETGVGTNFRTRYAKFTCRPPLLKDVLYCLILDSSVLDHPTFESWASDYGYDADSRKAKNIYNVCLKLALKLRQLLNSEEMRALTELFADY